MNKKKLVGKPEGTRPLERQRLRWEDNIRTDLRDMGWECVDWMHLALERDQGGALMNTIMNFPVP
jgi:hypothetical protein